MGEQTKKTIKSLAARVDPPLVDRSDPRLESLRASRRAALNLMEDAVRAKQRADELIAQLNDEIEARKRAEAALKLKQSRKEFLLRLADTVRPLDDPEEIKSVSAGMLEDELEADTVFYAEITSDDLFLTITDHNKNRGAGDTGRFNVDDALGPMLSKLRRRRTVAVENAAEAIGARHRGKAQLSAFGEGAFIAQPVVRNGRLAAILVIAHRTPRGWTEGDLEYAEEVAARSWAAVERARSKSALQVSEERYLALFNAIDQGFCTIEVAFDENDKAIDYRFLEVSPSFEQQTGIENGAGRWMREIAPDQDEFWFETYGRVALTGNPERFESFSSPLNKWWNVYAFRIGDPDLRRIAVLFNDISERKAMEGEISASTERLRLLMESATEVAIFTTDTNGIINTWNSGSERIFGYAEGEILGKCVEILFTEEDRERKMHEAEMRTAIENGRALDERWHVRKDGTTFFASGLTQPLGEGGEGFVKIARDMTERIQAERARREKELIQMLVEAQEGERKRIARDLHDELGQQLTALRLKLDNVGKDLPEELEGKMSEVKEIAESIDHGVDFLAWELRPAALDDLGLVPALAKYITEWTNYSRVPAYMNSASVANKRFDPAVETALYRIVQEGLNNVHKHAHAKNAEVTLQIRAGNLVLIVDDDGVGFDPQDQSLQHNGIGLIGIQERAQIIGGTFELESEPGHGTTIYVKTPLDSTNGGGGEETKVSGTL
jgi:PAS domain S-box-containing protein